MHTEAHRQVLLWSAISVAVGLLVGYGIGASMDGKMKERDVAEAPPMAPTEERAPMPPATDVEGEKKRSDLRTAIHRLWEDHVTWTRLYIIGVADGAKDLDVTAARLMQNQDDIGDAIVPYYGREAGTELSRLLREHISGAVDILDAAKKKDTAKMDAAIAAWRVNGDQIAAFLNKANPEHWPLEAMKAAMKEHLDTTLVEATARLEGRYADDVKAYDEVKDHIYMMADTLTDGIIRQFPDKF